MNSGDLAMLFAIKGPRDYFLHVVNVAQPTGLVEARCGMEGRGTTPTQWEILNLPTCPHCEGAPRAILVAA